MRVTQDLYQMYKKTGFSRGDNGVRERMNEWASEWVWEVWWQWSEKHRKRKVNATVQSQEMTLLANLQSTSKLKTWIERDERKRERKKKKRECEEEDGGRVNFWIWIWNWTQRHRGILISPSLLLYSLLSLIYSPLAFTFLSSSTP